MSSAALADQVRAGALSPEALVEESTHRIQAHCELNAFVPSDAPPIVGHPSGELAGVPISVKDNFLVKGQICRCGSRALEGYRAPYTAHVVEQLLGAGASLVGRTNMDEFGMGSTTESSCFGPTLNPWNSEHVPGGSSGGAAASVATGLTTIAIGSSTGGSLRQPAAYCGVVGLKPTNGRLSRRGLVAYASSLDVPGVIGTRVGDCALALRAMVGSDPLDSSQLSADHLTPIPAQLHADARGLRIGLIQEALSPDNHPDINAQMENCAALLQSSGAEVERCSLPDLDRSLAAYYVIAPAEASSNLARMDGLRFGPSVESSSLNQLYRRNRSQGFGREVKRRILMGTYCLSAGYIEGTYRRALQQQRQLRAQLEHLFEHYDALMLPTTPDVAPKLGAHADPHQMMLGDIYTVLANLAGIPALSLPCGTSRGLPVGVQLMAAHGHEGLLLSTARALEERLQAPSLLS